MTCLPSLMKNRPPPARGGRALVASGAQVPTASVTHFLVKLVFAAPASFFSAACASQVALASVSHFFMKLFLAAPASFFSPDCALQLGVCAKLPLASAVSASAIAMVVIRIMGRLLQVQAFRGAGFLPRPVRRPQSA